MPDKIVVLSDRIKELSETTGTTNMHLQGASVGFSPFSEFYSNSDLVYYAITDGQYYEVGSGQFLLKAGDDELVRFPFKSDGPGATLDTDKVSWPVGVKEVYVTYPAPQSVYTAFGLSPDYNQPKESGFAFWSSANILNYDSNLVWNSGQGRMGIGVNPDHALHIGGNTAYSLIKASGFIASESGLFFPQGNGGTPTYSGGRQLEHFVRNKLDDTAVSEGKLGESTGSSSVIELSGVVDQYILLKQQIKGSVFAGPPSGCGVSCSPAYPNFRYLTLADIPDLSSLYVTRTGTTSAGNVAFWKEDNVLTDDDYLTWNDTDNKLGVGNNDPQYRLHVGGAAGITGNTHIGGDTVASGDMFIGGNLDVAGGLTYIDSNIVTIWDRQLELASMSGTAIVGDTAIDGVGGAGLIIKSTDGDKSILWRSTCDAWQVKGKDGYNLIDVSGIIFNGDCDHLISGAYKAGSGLSLHGGLEFNVGDMFSLGTSPSQTIHQGDTILVSGVSGVATMMSKVGNNHILWVDPTQLSGILSGGSSASLLEVSGILDNYIDFVSGEFVSGSGALNNRIDEIDDGGVGVITVSGMFVSGSGALHNEIVSSSGQFLTGSGLSMGKNIPFQLETDGSGNFRTIGFHGTADGAAPASTNSQLYAQGANLYWHGTQLDTGTGATNLPGLTDVDSSMSPSGEEVLIYRGSEWSSSASSSGILRAGIVFNSGNITTNTTNIVTNATDIVTASGALRADIVTNATNFVSGSGALNNKIDGISDGGVGVVTVSGMFVSGSGALNNRIATNVTNIATNVADILIASGALHAEIAASGRTAGSGLVDNGTNSLHLGDPSNDYSAITAANAVGADQILVWDDSISSWKHISLTELNASAYVSDGTVDPGNDSVLFITDAGDVKKESWADFANLIAGNNISTDGDGLLDGQVGGAGGDANQDAFSKIKINNNADAGGAGPQVDAENTTDTVDFQSGDGIVITSTAGSEGAVAWGAPDIAVASGALRADITTNATNIATNATDIVTASGALRADITGIADNTTNIATNATDIVTASGALRADITTNATDIVTASGALRLGITDNTTNITTNATDIVTASGALREGVVTVSGMFVSGSGALNNKIDNLPGSVVLTADSGVIRVADEFRLNPNLLTSGDGTFLAVGTHHVGSWDIDAGLAHVGTNSVMIGNSAGRYASGCTYTNMMGHQAGYGATGCNYTNMMGHEAGVLTTGCDKTNMIGQWAGQWATGCTNTNMIGYQAGRQVHGCDSTNMMGHEAGREANDCSNGNMLGTLAGYQATGCHYTNMIGYEAGLEADTCRTGIMIGYRAGIRATGCNHTSMMGYQAGKEASGCDQTNMIGHYAGQGASGCNQTNMMGYKAGLQATGCVSTNMMGDQAGASATGCDYTNMMGYQAGASATGCDWTNIIGINAGSNASGCDYTNMMGYKAGWGSHDCDNATMIGSWAGQDATGCDYTNIMGWQAGKEATSCNSNNIIGFNAGYKAKDNNKSNFIGFQAGEWTDDVDWCDAIGVNAGRFASGIDNAVFLGIDAGGSTKKLVNNVSIGNSAGAHSNGDEWTTNIGYQAGFEGSGSTNGISIGDYAGYKSTKSKQRVALGYKAQEHASGVRSFVAIGANAGAGASGWKDEAKTLPYIPGHSVYSTSLHQYSIGIGSDAAKMTQNTNQLIAIGRRAGSFTYDAQHVIALGYRAGIQRKENDHSIYIGRDAGKYSDDDGDTPTVAGGSHQLFIGHDAGKFNTGNQNMSILANGSTANDAINAGTKNSPKTHNNRLNIANLIYGHTGSTAGLDRKLMIGYVAHWTGTAWEDPHTHLATLHVVPANAGHTEVCLHLAAAQNNDTITDRLTSTGYPGNSSSVPPANAINARMTTKTSIRDTIFTTTSNQYIADMSGERMEDDTRWSKFYNVDSEGNMAVIGQRGLPIVPSLHRTMTDGEPNWANNITDTVANGFPLHRQSLLKWFSNKYDKNDYEIGTMIFAEFSHGPSEAIWPYLMILGHRNHTGTIEPAWRYIPMPSYDVVDGYGWDSNTNTSTTLNQYFYGLPQGAGTANNNTDAKATVKARWNNGSSGSF